MSYEEKGTWAYLVASAGTYIVYLAIVSPRLQSTPAAQVQYVAVLLWTVAASIIAATVIRTLIETPAPATAAAATSATRKSPGTANTPAAGSSSPAPPPPSRWPW